MNQKVSKMSLNKMIVIVGVAVLLVSSSYGASLRPVPIEEANLPCICTEEYLPICASNNRTFGNVCEFNCQKKRDSELSIRYNGECHDDVQKVSKETSLGNCVCSRELKQICGSNNVTYSNQCTFDCARNTNNQLTVRYLGECNGEIEHFPVEDESDGCICQKIFTPLCASNGKTYNNDCEFRCAQRKDRSLVIDSMGECNAVKDDSCVCNFNYSPVCGSNGRTFPNKCVLLCEQKKDDGLKIEHDGKCA